MGTSLVPKPRVRRGESPTDRREVLNAILYVDRTGCQCRYLPHDFPSWKTVSDYFYQWRDDGTFERIADVRRRKVRQLEGRNPEPTLGILDSASRQATEVGGPTGFDAWKKVKGPKHHRLAASAETAIRVQVVERNRDGPSCFHVVPKRWIVERTFGWLNREGRLAKAYDRHPDVRGFTSAPCGSWHGSSQPLPDYESDQTRFQVGGLRGTRALGRHGTSSLHRNSDGHALSGRTPIVVIIASKGFLRGGGSADALRAFLGQTGGRIGLAGQEATVAGQQQQATALGRVLHTGDAQIAAGTMREGIPLVTNDVRFGNFRCAIGFPVEGF